tara:strand:- start:1260 stop:2033 length:774 start_codon:yes stop_codon:yes gene_type:complete
MRFQLILFIFSCSIYSQNVLYIEKVESITYENTKKLICIDNLGNKFYLGDNELFKGENLKFSDKSLGKISKVDLYNSLKIKLWYNDFNTLIILDNYLNEIKRINFDNLDNLSDISNISTANDNFIWVYDEISMKIKKFDYLKNLYVDGIETPLDENVIDLESNYNFLWVLTSNYFIKLNYNGSVVFKIPNNKFNKINLFKNNIILNSNLDLVYFNNDNKSFSKIKSEKLFIKDFFVINETLYIYDKDHLNKYLILSY